MSDIKRIMIVDDSRVSRMMIMSHIKNFKPDWVIIEASSGEEALEKARDLAPDLVSMDVNMPGMGGVAAAEQFVKEFPEIHLSLLTANVQDATRKLAERLNIGFIEKPVTAERIKTMLSLLDHD